MNSGIRPSLGERIIARIEVTTITALQMLLVVLVVVATVALYVLFAKNLYNEMAQIESVTALLPAMQRSFAGILTVVLGLELLEREKIPALAGSDKPAAIQFVNRMHQAGVLTIPAGTQIVRLLPPLNLKPQEAGEGISRIEEVVKLLG